MAIPNSTYTQALTASIANYRDELADAITANNAFLTYLRKQGNTDPFDGGNEILENVLYNSATGGWYSGSEILSTADSDVLTSANYAIKQFYANVTMSGLEIIQNSGKERMFKLIDGKLQAAKATLANGIGAALFYSNTENSGKSIGGNSSSTYVQLHDRRSSDSSKLRSATRYFVRSKVMSSQYWR